MLFHKKVEVRSIAGEHAGLSSSMAEREQIAKLRAVAIDSL
jgi:hypothetical protein